MRYPALVILIILSSLACNRQTIDHSVISVDIDKQDKVSVFDLFSNIRIIPLETTDESLLASIFRIVKYENNIYILDRKQHTLLIFDDNGKYISKINNLGRGPEEYSAIYDVKINPFTKNLELLDPMGKLLAFTLSGEFISSFRLPNTLHAYHEFVHINQDSLLFFTSSEPFTLNLYSRKENKIIENYCSQQKSSTIGSPLSSFYRYNDTVYFSQYLSDVVMQFSPDGMKPAYEWFFPEYDFDANSLIPDQRSNNIKDFLSLCESFPYTYVANFQNKHYKYVEICPEQRKRVISIFHSNETGDNLIFEKTKEGFFFYPLFMDDFVAISHVPVKDRVDDFLNPGTLDAESRNILDNLSEQDNEFLIEYTFKTK